MTDTEEIEYKYVLGQDPGGTTGVAVLRYTDNTPPELVYLHQIEGGREGFFQFFIGTEVGEGTNIVSVSEMWITREGVPGADLTPTYIEGIQDAIWGFQTVYQSPAVKPMIGDEFLKINNLWTEGKRHQMDALLHALYWLSRNNHEPTLKALSGDLAEPLAEPGEADEKTLGQQPGQDGAGDGEGEGGEPGDDGVGTAAEAIMQMIAKLHEDNELGDQDGTDAEGFIDDGTDYEDDGKQSGSTTKRTLNGAFIGFEEDDD